MSTIIQSNNGVSITRYAAGHGRIGFQVTWRSEEPGRLFDYVSFESQEIAEQVAALVEQRLVR